MMTIHSPTIGAATGAGQRLRIAVFIEHDIIYRHFVQSRVFAELVRQHAVTFVFPAKETANKRLTIDPDPIEVGAPIVRVPLDQKRLTMWRRLFQVSQLCWRPGSDWAHLRRVMRYLVGARASKLYTVLALPGVFQLYRAWTYRQISRMPTVLDPLLDRLAPDIIVHPTVLDGYYVNDLVLLGHRRGIPTIAIMNSWDNPGTKRAVVGHPDRLLVWGAQTRDLAIRYMGIAPDRVVCFGAAQFDLYRNPPRITRDEFCRRHDIDPAKTILLYAGSSKGSDEFAHLCAIEDAIDSGALAGVAAVYRPHPWGQGGHKGERVLDHPWRHVRIETSMRAYLEQLRVDRTRIFMADYAETHDVLASVDAVISPLSTIILEAMLHGKPVLCFLPDLAEGSSFDLQAKLVHFDALYASPAVLVANGDAELITGATDLVARVGASELPASLAAACSNIVTPHDRSYAERLADLVVSLAQQAGPRRDA